MRTANNPWRLSSSNSNGLRSLGPVPILVAGTGPAGGIQEWDACGCRVGMKRSPSDVRRAAFPVYPVGVGLRARPQMEADKPCQSPGGSPRPSSSPPYLTRLGDPTDTLAVPSVFRDRGTSYTYTRRSQEAELRSDTDVQPPSRPPEQHFEGWSLPAAGRQ